MADGARRACKDHTWRVSRYARFIPFSITQTSSSTSRSAASGSGPSGTWKHYGENDLDGSALRLTLYQGGRLLLGAKREVFENILLWNAQKWLRVVAKGDSLLVVWEKPGNASRRFRMRFQATEGKSADKHCSDCASVLSFYAEVKDLNAGASVGNAFTGAAPNAHVRMQRPPSGDGPTLTTSQELAAGRKPATPSRSASMPDIAKQYLSDVEDGLPLGVAYQTTGFPTHQLPMLVQLCLTDSNFPAFVEAVDKELKKLVEQ